MKRAELVFVPSPGLSHLASTLEFARLLINRDERLSITFLVMKLPFDTTVHDYIQSLASSTFPERIRFIDLPSHNPEGDQPLPRSFVSNFIQSQKPHVREAVSNLTESNLHPDSPRLAAFVVDMFCMTMGDVAREFGVPTYMFFTSGAAFLYSMLHFHTLRERDNFDTTEFKDSDAELEIPSFANPVPAKALPSVVLEKEAISFAIDNYAKSLKEPKGIIVNTFEELESHAVHSFSDSGYPPIYPVGPVLNLMGDHENAQISDDVTKWLDDQPESSVVFLCFGSRGALEEHQVKEIAHALEVSGTRFLWALRKPTMALPIDYDNLEEILPEGFLDRTAQIGKVIGWAPQVEILAHKAVGGFVSHCGWNSTLESIYFGVPIATWPLYAEQQTNAFLIVAELGLGVEIAIDYRIDFQTGKSKEILSAEKIVKGIKDLMEEESEIRNNMKEMSEKSRSTLVEGGCSYSFLGRLIDDIISMI